MDTPENTDNHEESSGENMKMEGGHMDNSSIPPEPMVTPPPVNTAPQVSTSMAGTPVMKESKSSTGAIVGSIIIIVILIVGGLYLWGKKLTNDELNLEGPTAEEIEAQTDEELDALNAQSDSDEIDDIEADLDNTNLNDLDDELSNIDLSF